MKKLKEFSYVVPVFLFVLFIVGNVYGVIHALKNAAPDKSTFAFQEGDIVKTKIGGHIGMIQSVYGKNLYCIRFNATESMTNVSLRSSNWPTIFAEVCGIKEFELVEGQWK